MLGAEYVKWYFDHLGYFTTITGVVAFLIATLAFRGSDKVAHESLSRAATWCMLPTGGAFLLCSADLSLVPRISESSIAFFMGGLALLSLALPDIYALFGVKKASSP